MLLMRLFSAKLSPLAHNTGKMLLMLPPGVFSAKLVPLAYGIKKLQISTVVVDDKVSIDELEELITAFEDVVQSVDIAAFNKI